MKGLLYKEFLLFKPILIFIAGFQLLLGIACVSSVSMSAVEFDLPEEQVLIMKNVISSCCYFYPFLIMTLLNTNFWVSDEKKPWCSFVISTPQAARGHVASKYLSQLIINLGLLFSCFITDTVAVAVSGNTSISAISTAIMFFCMVLLINAIEIPFMVRFGASNGIKVKSMVVLGAFFLAALYGLFGDISFLFGDAPLTDFVNFLQSGKIMCITAIIPYAAVLLYYISYRISLKLYQKGVSSYEQ